MKGYVVFSNDNISNTTFVNTERIVGDNCLVVKMLYSTIANGLVTSIDSTKAEGLPGVVRVFTCLGVPERSYFCSDVAANRRHPADKMLLSRRVLHYGEPVAAVVAVDERSAKKALSFIKVSYNEYSPILNPGDTGESDIQNHVAGNLRAHIEYTLGEMSKEETKTYSSCYNVGSTLLDENNGCHCYMDEERLTVVSDANAYAVRLAVGAACDLPLSRVSVKGRGSVDKIVHEPLCAYICLALNGQPVKILADDRRMFRAPFRFKLQSALSSNGTFVGRELALKTTGGAYSVDVEDAAANATNLFRQLYSAHGSVSAKADTYLTTTPTAFAGEGFGHAAALFAIESHMDDIAFDMGVDPMLLRIKNCIRAGYNDPLDNITASGYALDRCIIRGRELTDWDTKQKLYAEGTGDVRKGLGMAIFSYNDTRRQPAVATVKLTLGSDGSMSVNLGRSADSYERKLYTKFIVDALGIKEQSIGFVSGDGSAPDAGQYTTSFAIKDAIALLKSRLIDHANLIMGCDIATPEIKDGILLDTQNDHRVTSITDIAFHAHQNGMILSAEATCNRQNSVLSFGAAFAEVTVNISLCSVTLNRLIVIIDSGKVHLPDEAREITLEMMLSAVDYTLGEELSINMQNGSFANTQTGKGFDLEECRMEVEFVDVQESNSAFGDKPLGDAAFLPVAPAVRNAIFNATGIKFSTLPITSKQLFVEFKKAGMI